MAWRSIAASETDANSPLNQVLMDGIRGNLDYLKSVGASMKFLTAYAANNADNVDIVLDDTQDWRDRYLCVRGQVFQGTSADCAAVELGGAQDKVIGSPYPAAPLNLRAALFDHWMYTSTGSSARTTNPKLWAEDPGGDPDFFIWVNSSTGYLMLGAVTARPSGYKNLVYHLRLTWSEDMGGH